MAHTRESFTLVDTALMLNTLVQMLPIVLVSTFMTYLSTHDIAWGLSILAMFGSMTTMICGEASYESDRNNRGNYFKTATQYNPLAGSSAICLLLAIDIHVLNTSLSTTRQMCLGLANLITLGYIAGVYVNKR